MNPFEASLIDITQSVWRATLGLEVTPAPAEPSADGFPCRSTVVLDGDWCGSLTISSPPELARSVAALFYAKPPAEVSEAEMLDALGELANMTGGNLKGVLPGESRISTPRSIRGPGAAAASGDLRLDFACGACRFTVDLAKENRS